MSIEKKDGNPRTDAISVKDAEIANWRKQALEENAALDEAMKMIERKDAVIVYLMGAVRRFLQDHSSLCVGCEWGRSGFKGLAVALEKASSENAATGWGKAGNAGSGDVEKNKEVRNAGC